MDGNIAELRAGTQIDPLATAYRHRPARSRSRRRARLAIPSGGARDYFFRPGPDRHGVGQQYGSTAADAPGSERYFLKESPLSRLAEGIRAIASRPTWLDKLYANLANPDGLREAGQAPKFNERQRKALRFVLLKGCPITKSPDSYRSRELRQIDSSTPVSADRSSDSRQLVRVALENYEDQLS